MENGRLSSSAFVVLEHLTGISSGPLSIAKFPDLIQSTAVSDASLTIFLSSSAFVILEHSTGISRGPLSTAGVSDLIQSITVLDVSLTTS